MSEVSDPKACKVPVGVGIPASLVNTTVEIKRPVRVGPGNTVTSKTLITPKRVNGVLGMSRRVFHATDGRLSFPIGRVMVNAHDSDGDLVDVQEGDLVNWIQPDTTVSEDREIVARDVGWVGSRVSHYLLEVGPSGR